jgi:hypothetical protein
MQLERLVIEPSLSINTAVGNNVSLMTLGSRHAPNVRSAASRGAARHASTIAPERVDQPDVTDRKTSDILLRLDQQVQVVLD